MAVHLFAILANDVREGHVATITSHVGLDIVISPLVTLR
jgi:hypothetical protein